MGNAYVWLSRVSLLPLSAVTKNHNLKENTKMGTPIAARAEVEASCNLAIPAIYCHDNLDILQNINSETVDLVYLDPPFNTGKAFHAPIGTTAEGAAFSDIWREDDVKEWQHLELADSHPGLYRYIDSVEDIGSKSAKWYLIYMAVRLIEIHRILKPTGSVFLHCDPTANYYLRFIMDAIWGHQNFRNDITWCYTGTSQAKRWFPRKSDTILFYVKNSKEAIFIPDAVRIPYKNKKMPRRRNDPGRNRGGSGKWREAGSEEEIQAIAAKGKVPEDWWDIPFGPNNPERTGYPTQKPLKLLERIILATTKEGDLVLDPFCGCATTCVAAHKLNRRWVGIDVSEMAYTLVQERLEQEANQGNLADPDFGHIAYETTPPLRTDLGVIRPLKGKWKQEVRMMLYGKQAGNCVACGTHQEFPSNLHIDHIRPTSRGGSDHLDNLQLLCGGCNSTKGNRPMSYLYQRIAKRAA